MKMSEINRIHVNNSTRVSLNDRFTFLSYSKTPRSKTRRNDGNLPPRSSEANRNLVHRLSVKHSKVKAKPIITQRVF